jgi:gluconolactonase
MRRALLLAMLVVLIGFVSLVAQTATGSVVVKLDPALDAIISTNARLEMLKSDYFGISEGPVWIQEGQNGYLLFSDIGGNVIYKWTPDNKFTVFLDKAGWTGTNVGEVVGFVANSGHLFIVNFGPNGVTVDTQGRVVFTAQGDRAIVRLEKDGKRTVLADRFEGKRLNRPNDLVVKSDGWIYFTDPRPMNNPSIELPNAGLYRVKEGNSDLQLLDKDITPNGLAFSPDEKILYVNGGGQIFRYDVQSDGTLTNKRLFIDPRASGDKAPGNPDGMKVDRAGNLWSTGPGGIWIISPAGKHIGTILLPEPATNLAFGDADGKTLYITDRRSFARIRLNAPGITPGIRGPS